MEEAAEAVETAVAVDAADFLDTRHPHYSAKLAAAVAPGNM